MERTKIDITDFNDTIHGGLPEDGTVVLTGAPGAGKSIIGAQYICEGAKLGESRIYITFEQNEQDLIEQALQSGCDLDKYMKIVWIVKSEYAYNRYDAEDRCHAQLDLEYLIRKDFVKMIGLAEV